MPGFEPDPPNMGVLPLHHFVCLPFGHATVAPFEGLTDSSSFHYRTGYNYEEKEKPMLLSFLEVLVYINEQ